MTVPLPRILTYIGLFLTAHSAYSCLHYRDLVGSHTSHPPLDVVVEVMAGFLLCLLGRLSAATFLDVRATKPSQLFPPAYRTRDFDIYNNRMKFMTAQKSK